VNSHLALLTFRKTSLSKEFEMINSREFFYCLGIKVRWNQRLKKIHLSLEKYLNDILAYFRMDSCHLITTPFLVVVKLNKSVTPIIVEDVIAMNNIPYKNVVGSLMHAMVCTCFDLVDLVFHISQFMNNPRKGPLDYYKKRFYGTLQLRAYLGIIYFHSSIMSFISWCDSYWVVDVDNFWSIIGCLFQSANGLYHGNIKSNPLLPFVLLKYNTSQ
jgi:hypothetical protein